VKNGAILTHSAFPVSEIFVIRCPFASPNYYIGLYYHHPQTPNLHDNRVAKNMYKTSGKQLHMQACSAHKWKLLSDCALCLCNLPVKL
jgi:hypothetical protein